MAQRRHFLRNDHVNSINVSLYVTFPIDSSLFLGNSANEGRAEGSILIRSPGPKVYIFIYLSFYHVWIWQPLKRWAAEGAAAARGWAQWLTKWHRHLPTVVKRQGRPTLKKRKQVCTEERGAQRDPKITISHHLHPKLQGCRSHQSELIPTPTSPRLPPSPSCMNAFILFVLAFYWVNIYTGWF